MENLQQENIKLQEENTKLKNTIQELEKSGLPTGPLPDGSPNLGLIAAASSLKGSSKESQENGKIEFAIPPLAVGIVTTAPTKFSGIPI